MITDENGEQLWVHDFHARCNFGHKRNFTYMHGKQPLHQVIGRCVICGSPREFTIQNYWEEIRPATEADYGPGTYMEKP